MSENQNIEPSTETVEHVKLTFFGRIRTYFLAGVLVTAPISITIYLTWTFLQFLDNKITPLIPAAYNPNTYLPFSMPGLGLIIAVVFFVLVGFVARNFLGRLFVRMYEYVLDHVPVINTLYGAIKQIFETVMASQSDAFKEVVMFEYPRKGLWVLGFVTGRTKGEVQTLTKSETVNVFLPTTPNPTSGFLLFVPKKDVTYMEMTVEEGIKMIVSGGIITPPTPADKAEANGRKKKLL
ncbi:MAG: hypothetical protein CMH31_00575 [Micavibrio sp.]|nr:hypothetical protein [Micavibrio sp.]|tara:strand:+ start:1243 stop:1953 length:711 start_codon:yes stop_codon:yes gene_type:complete